MILFCQFTRQLLKPTHDMLRREARMQNYRAKTKEQENPSTVDRIQQGKTIGVGHHRAWSSPSMRQDNPSRSHFHIHHPTEPANSPQPWNRPTFCVPPSSSPLSLQSTFHPQIHTSDPNIHSLLSKIHNFFLPSPQLGQGQEGCHLVQQIREKRPQGRLHRNHS